MNRFSFNLLERPWIPCIDLHGKRNSLGLRDILVRAHEISRIEPQNPLTEAALLRVLLAAVHRIVDGPRRVGDWKGLYLAGRFPAERIDEYFGKWRDRFDLFSTDFPFYQTPGLRILDAGGRDSPAHISSIILELSSGNNKTVFNHTTDISNVSLTPAQAAAALVTAQMYSLGGLNRKTTNLFGYQQSYLNAVMVNGIFVVLQGESLFHTLTLNLNVYSDVQPMPSTSRDCPVWESAENGEVGAAVPRGYLDFLTGRCRHLLLVPETNSDGDIHVSSVHIAQGVAFPDVENPGYFQRKSRKDGTLIPVQLQPDRLLWRDSSSLFAFDADSDHRPLAFRLVGDIALRKVVPLASQYRCYTYGLANDKANPLAWRKETLDIPLALLSDRDLVDCLERAMDFSEKAGTILSDAVRDYVRGCLPKDSKDVTQKANGAGAANVYWDRLERHFRDFVLDLEKKDEALTTWFDRVKRTARESFDTCMKHHYADSAKALRAWVEASRRLNGRLASLDPEGGKRE